MNTKTKYIFLIILLLLVFSISKAQILKICTQEENLKHNATTEWGTMFSHSKNRTIGQLVDYPMGLLFLPKDGKGLLNREGARIMQTLIHRNTGVEADLESTEKGCNMFLLSQDGYNCQIGELSIDDTALFVNEKGKEPSYWWFTIYLDEKKYKQEKINEIIEKWIDALKMYGYNVNKMKTFIERDYFCAKDNKKVDIQMSNLGTSLHLRITVFPDLSNKNETK